MSNLPHDNIYSILGKLETIQGKDKVVEQKAPTVSKKTPLQESIAAVESSKTKIESKLARQLNEFKTDESRASSIDYDFAMQHMQRPTEKLAVQKPGVFNSQAEAQKWIDDNNLGAKYRILGPAMTKSRKYELTSLQEDEFDDFLNDMDDEEYYKYGTSDFDPEGDQRKSDKELGVKLRPGAFIDDETMAEAVHTGTYGTSYYSSPDFTGDEEGTGEKRGRGRPKKADSERASASLPKFSGKDVKLPKAPAHAVTRHSISDAPPKGSPEYADYAAKQARAAKRKGKNLAEAMHLLSRRLIEGVNFRQMAEETHQSIDALMSELQKDIAEYKATGHCSDALKDFLQVHQYSKKFDGNVASALTSEATPAPAAPAQRTAPAASMDFELNELARLAGLDVPASTPLDEGGMSEVDLLMQDIGAGRVDIYDVMNHPKTRIEQAAAGMLQQMYDEVAIDNHLHPDDDFESILDIMADQIAKDHPSLDEAAIDVSEPSIDPINAPKEEYKTMRQSTLNPGEGDFGEKGMHPDRPTFKNGDNALAKPTLESRLAAEYESIKKKVTTEDRAEDIYGIVAGQKGHKGRNIADKLMDLLIGHGNKNAAVIIKFLKQYGLTDAEISEVRDIANQAGKTALDYVAKKHNVPEKYLASDMKSNFIVYSPFLNAGDEVIDQWKELTNKILLPKLRRQLGSGLYEEGNEDSNKLKASTHESEMSAGEWKKLVNAKFPRAKIMSDGHSWTAKVNGRNVCMFIFDR